MTKMKPEDTKAAELTFGVELETVIPVGSNLSVGSYHHGDPVMGATKPDGTFLPAPCLPNGQRFNSQRDGSLEMGLPSGFKGCEFVSPILKGDDGVRFLLSFVQWIKDIGGKVTTQCGMHVHVGVKSIVGEGATPDDTVNYLAKLGAVCQRLGLAFYSQTGAARHENQFCKPVGASEKDLIDSARRERDQFRKTSYLGMWDKYRLLNLRPVGGKGTVEFRAFAGTLNASKVLHHLATCLGACRYAMVVKRAQWGVNTKNWWNGGNGENALRLLWAVFGWQAASSSSTHSFGLFGSLYSEFATYRETALRMSKKFDQKFPGVALPSGNIGTSL